MLKIINVIELDQYKREDNSVYGLLLEITMSNNIKNVIDFWDSSIEDIKKILYNMDWKDKTIESLERFRCDEEEEFERNNEGQETFYEILIGKIADDIELSENDLIAINECVNICTVFKEFDYKTWVIDI